MPRKRVKKIAVLTSGGDSPGMNAAVRAVVRVAIDQGMEVYRINQGYAGLVNDDIALIRWGEVGGILNKGGTFLGTKRYDELKDPARQGEVLKKIEGNLKRREIDGLVVIGGDGSFRGAKLISEKIIGVPATIDNDLFGTDMSIGADTALNTIVRSVDMLSSTADALRRTFVVEVMGRDCGYLALMGALGSGADWALIPEEGLGDEWADKMAEAIRQGYEAGRGHGIVVLAEGARRRDGTLISREDVQEILEGELDRLPDKGEARVTVLGHVQRGGSPSAFDRILGARLGEAAVRAVQASETAKMVRLADRRAKLISFKEVVERSDELREALRNRDYELVRKLRGEGFNELLQLFKVLSRAKPEKEPSPDKRVAVLTDGADAPGMNAAVRAATRFALNQGLEVWGIRDGYRGLFEEETWEQKKKISWMDVDNWISQAGSNLGSSRTRRFEIESLDHGFDVVGSIAAHIESFNIEGLVIIGGISSLLRTEELKSSSILEIPLLFIPATIDNDIPGTDLCIGADTALNAIVEAIDNIKETASATHRILIVEVMGGHCGYLALMGGLAGGADVVFIPEKGIDLKGLNHQLSLVEEGFEKGKNHGIIIYSERASKRYNADFIRRVVEEEKGFETRITILGYIQRGRSPSVFDRILASRLGAKAVSELLTQIKTGDKGAQVVGLRGGRIELTDLSEVMNFVAPENEHLKDPWFLRLSNLGEILAKPGPSQDEGSR